jgi:hypothetical protein
MQSSEGGVKPNCQAQTVVELAKVEKKNEFSFN